MASSEDADTTDGWFHQADLDAEMTRVRQAVRAELAALPAPDPGPPTTPHGWARHRLLLGGLLVVAVTVVLVVAAVVDARSLWDEPPREGVAWSRLIDTPAEAPPVATVGRSVIVQDGTGLVGLSRDTGRQVWRRDLAGGRYRIAGGLVVVVAHAGRDQDGPVEVLDPAAGITRWRTRGPVRKVTVFDRVVFLGACTSAPRALFGDCTITARAAADGHTLWSLRSQAAAVVDDAVGVRDPYAPPLGRYVAVAVGGRDPARPWAAVDTTTGRVLPGRFHLDGWRIYPVGPLLVATDRDPPAGDRRCTVTAAAVDARTGATAWSGTWSSGRRTDGTCHTLPGLWTGLDEIGAGTRVAAVTAGGRPELVDLATGQPVWTSRAVGTPVDADADAILVRQHPDTGPISVLDARTGRTRWSAPNPGMDGTSASWQSFVTGRLVAVNATADQQAYVRVYDTETGLPRGRWRGWLAGAGPDWVAVTHLVRGADRVALDFIPR